MDQELELYCDYWGPRPLANGHNLREADYELLHARKSLRTRPGSTDAHGGDLAAFDMGVGVSRQLKCRCGAPMRLRLRPAPVVPVTATVVSALERN